jgi:hypothetical protein
MTEKHKTIVPFIQLSHHLTIWTLRRSNESKLNKTRIHNFSLRLIEISRKQLMGQRRSRGIVADQRFLWLVQFPARRIMPCRPPAVSSHWWMCIIGSFPVHWASSMRFSPCRSLMRRPLVAWPRINFWHARAWKASRSMRHSLLLLTGAPRFYN